MLRFFFSFFITFFLSYFFLLFPLWFIGLHRFFLLCVCFFGQTLTIAQLHTSVCKYVKYIVQGCCESVMDFFSFFFFFKRLHMDTVYTDYYAFLKLNSLSNKKTRS